ncbi:MAG: hypothetical protein WCW93_02230 [Candidatus Paceibacterota bacterium]
MILTFLRSFRIGPFAIFDFAVAYIAVYFIAPYLSKLFALVGIHVNREQWLWLTLPIAVVAHLIFKADTPFTKMILNPSGDWIPKLIIIGMLIMAYVYRS